VHVLIEAGPLQGFEATQFFDAEIATPEYLADNRRLAERARQQRASGRKDDQSTAAEPTEPPLD
jgi:hypothetical protein